jgi:hypothetical protein
MKTKGYTLKELAENLKISEHATHMRICRARIAPMFRGAIYPLDSLDRIYALMSRHKKVPKEPETQ